MFPPCQSFEFLNSRDLLEIKESERRAHSQAEILKNALDEHSLELRVKAANEAEAACQQRLSAAEAEIAELMAKLDASKRFIFYLMFCITYLTRLKVSLSNGNNLIGSGK